MGMVAEEELTSLSDFRLLFYEVTMPEFRDAIHEIVLFAIHC